MNIEFKCPQCGQIVEADESDRGQVAACPHCGKGIVVPRGKTNGEVQRPESKVVHIKCPHCGTAYEVSRQDMCRRTSCEVCGKSFVIGTTGPITQAANAKTATSQTYPTPCPHQIMDVGKNDSEPSARIPKLTIWIAAGAACMVVMLTFAFVLGRHSGQSDSPAKAIAMMRTDDGNKPMEEKATIPVSNEANAKSSEDTIPAGDAISETDVGTVVKTETEPKSSNTSGNLPEEVTPAMDIKTEKEEVATTNDETETSRQHSSRERMNDDDVKGEADMSMAKMIASPTNLKMREFAGHRLGEIYEGKIEIIEIDPRNPKPFTIKQHLKGNAGPFVGFEAEFGYTVKSKQLAFIVVHTPYDPNKEIEKKLTEKELYKYYGISNRDIDAIRNGSRTLSVPLKNQDIRPYGVCLNGVIYGRDMDWRSHKTYACIADIKLLNELNDELIEMQDTAITKYKLSTDSSTLQSFCGIRFGTRDSDVGGGESSVLIEGKEYQMPRSIMKCNKFRAFKDRADVWTSRSGNVFLIHVEPGDRPVGMERDGSLRKEAQTVLDILTKKYGKPFLLKKESRYNVVESRSHNPTPNYMFPIGHSGIYLFCGGRRERGLYCMNDIWARKAVENIAQNKKESVLAGYEVFASEDFFGFKLGAKSPSWMTKYINSTSANKMNDGTIIIKFFRDLPVKCRKLNSLKIGLSWTSHRIARITAEFEPFNRFEKPKEEFHSLCAMCEKKLKVKPQMGQNRNGKSLATFTAENNMRVTIQPCEYNGWFTQLTAESPAMLNLAKKEHEVWRVKDEAAKEASLSGVEALTGESAPDAKVPLAPGKSSGGKLHLTPRH